MSRLLLTVSVAALVAAAAASYAGNEPTWLKYDDGIAYHPVYRINAGDGWAVKFTPPSAGYIQQVTMYVGNPPKNEGWDGFDLEMWTWAGNANPAMPNLRVWGPKPFTYDHGGWVTYGNVGYYWPTTLAFVILVKQRYDYPNCDTLYCDTARTSPNPNLSYFDNEWAYFTLVNGDFLLRTLYGPCYPGVEPASMGRVKALFR